MKKNENSDVSMKENQILTLNNNQLLFAIKKKKHEVVVLKHALEKLNKT